MSPTTFTAVRDPKRLAALHALGLLDTSADEAFDRLARLASRLLQAPIALVSLVDEDRQFFKSCLGLPEPWASWRETPLSHSFCQHVVASCAPLIINDARSHPEFRDNLAIGDLGVVAYLGIPLTLPNGHTVGSFCVFDSVPRTWTALETETVRDFAALVMSEIELHAVHGRLKERIQEQAGELGDASQALGVSQAETQSAKAQIVKVVGRITDGEEALRASEERLRLALDAARMGTFDWDIPNNRIAWSRWHEELWGFKPGEFGGTYEAFSQRVHPDDLFDVDAEVARCIGAHERFAREFRVLWPDGSTHWIAGHGEFTFNKAGEAIRMRGAVVEITARKQAEAALQKSEEHFRNIFEQATDGILVSNVAGRFLDANSAICQMLGYSREELLSLSNADIIVPDQIAHIVPETARLQHGNVVRSEWRVRHRDGTILLVEVSAKQLPDGRLQAFLRDITERKQAEDALRQLTQELEQRVIERTADLAETNAELEAFSYTVSHDLRAPLRAMQGLAQALAEDYADKLDAHGQDYTQRLVRAAERMDELIQDLLAYSRLTRTALQPENVELNNVVLRAREQLAADIAKSGARLKVKKPLPVVVAHPPTLAQVVTNLISNALKFVADGVRPEVIIHAERRGDRVRLWVQDNGIGIEARYQERIFRVFERLHGIETYPGTGIGLAIVRKGVERMGGSAGVESTPGQGSRFWVELPAGARDPQK